MEHLELKIIRGNTVSEDLASSACGLGILTALQQGATVEVTTAEGGVEFGDSEQEFELRLPLSATRSDIEFALGAFVVALQKKGIPVRFKEVIAK